MNSMAHFPFWYHLLPHWHQKMHFWLHRIKHLLYWHWMCWNNQPGDTNRFVGQTKAINIQSNKRRGKAVKCHVWDWETGNTRPTSLNGGGTEEAWAIGRLALDVGRGLDQWIHRKAAGMKTPAEITAACQNLPHLPSYRTDKRLLVKEVRLESHSK